MASTQPFYLNNLVISHHRSPMKIGTDAILLGAVDKLIFNGSQCLEIGSGCGIITLMTARKYSGAYYYCLDIDPMAYKECSENIITNSLASKCCALLGDIRTYVPELRQFDVIFSNPPFFTSGQKPSDQGLLTAKHTHTLALEELAPHCHRLLKDNGLLYIILPVAEAGSFRRNAERHDMYLSEILSVRSFEESPPIREILTFVKGTERKKITLKQLTLFRSRQRNDWSEDYRQLLQGFKSF